MGIILASASPRRREILTMLGVKDMRIIPAVGDELVPENVPPEEIVRALALAKAREVAPLAREDEAVIAADTIVYHKGRIFGKPHSRREAEDMLRELSGDTHSVFTGIAVIKNDRELCRAEETKVSFRPLSEDEISAYIDSGEPMDKAGAYGAQGLASIFVQGIEGDFFNVMGLPVCLLDSMLRQFGMAFLSTMQA